MKKYLLLGVLAVLFAISLSAAENPKINLPDGLYMYDSWVSHAKGESVRFEKFFVVQNNIIYSSQEAIRKFGILKLNKLFTENKKYKILLGGEKIGEIQNLEVDDADGHRVYKEELLTKNFKEGPAYWKESIYVGSLGSAVKCLAVPEKYKEVKKKVYTTIPQGEVDKIAKLAKDKLFDLVKNRKEITDYQLKYTELNKEYIDLLDKISNRNDELYIGVYRYIFKIPENSRPFLVTTLAPAFEIAFSVKKDNLYIITSDYDGEMRICGMLDVDGCGEEELIIEKLFGGEAGPTINLEIYKQKSDGNWAQIKKINIRRPL